MPHLVVEYSANLDPRLDVMGLLNALHDAAIETKAFPVKGVRTRASRRDEFVIADKNPKNAFIHVVARIGVGRDAETKKAAGDAIFAALCDFTDGLFQDTPLALGFEFVEINTWKKNTIMAN